MIGVGKKTLYAEIMCGKCLSKNITLVDTGGVYFEYECKDCGLIFKDTISSEEYMLRRKKNEDDNNNRN
jgi:transcription initiation factor TFIIIB Brf1 subunit/transcription initiation factor TFIIB